MRPVSKKYSKKNRKNNRKTRRNKKGGAKPKYAFEGWDPKNDNMKEVGDLLGETNYTLDRYDADLRIIEENIVFYSKTNETKNYVGREACSGGCNFPESALDLNGPPGYGGPGRIGLRRLAEYVIVRLIEDVKKGRIAGSLLNPL